MAPTRGRSRLFLAVLAAVLLALALTPLMRRAVETVGALNAIAEVGRQTTADAAAHRNRLAPAPRRITYLVDGRLRTGDLYRNDGTMQASLVLVPGADVLGRDHPQFQAFAAVLSELGFAVLVPHMDNLQQLRIRAGDVTHIADAVRQMARFAPRDRGPSVGVLAVSYGVGPAVLAGLEDAARPHLRFVMGIGGYHDLGDVLTFLTTGHFRSGEADQWRQETPHSHGKWVFLASNAEFLSNPHDQVTLRLIARRKFAEPGAAIDDLAGLLSPEGAAVLDLITNTDPARVPVLIERLPEEALSHFRGLDPSAADLSKLRAQLILVHGRNDRFIPYTQSVALAHAADRARGAASLYVIDDMSHITLSASGAGDLWRLYRAVYELLHARDRAPAPDIPDTLGTPVDLTDPSETRSAAGEAENEERTP